MFRQCLEPEKSRLSNFEKNADEPFQKPSMFYLFLLLFFFAETCTTPDWLYYNNSCFKVFIEEVPWFDARKSCTTIGGNLISIHSIEENNFVRQEISLISHSSAWIGLFNLNSTDHSYEWVDGSMVDFRNWGDGEPNNANSGENCTELVVASNGIWNDESCHVNRTYVCGKKFSR